MMKTIYKVEGIHCASCEILIEETLSDIKGVKKVEVDLVKKEVAIESDFEIDLKKLNKLFKKNGYRFLELGEEKANNKENKWWWVWAVVIMAGFLGLSQLGLASLLNINSKSSLITFLILGVVAGVSSCGALLSGIILAFPGRTIRLLMGRLIGYAVLGAVLGMVGQGLAIGGLSNVLIILVSIIMLILGLQMLGVDWAQKINLSLPKNIGKKIVNEKMPFLVGLLTVLLPCGFTLLTESVAVISGNWLSGTLIMSAFVAGSSIPLFFMGLSGEKLLKNQKTMGLLILFFVLYNLNFQFGIIKPTLPSLEKGGLKTEVAAARVVKMTYTHIGGLSPNPVEVKKGEKVRLEIEVKDNEYGCMSTLMLPRLFPRAQTLRAGSTLVMEFTPTVTGSYQFTCAMGVPHRGVLNVTE